MDLAILDPNILYISEDDWLNEEIRDDYIEHFNNTLIGIDENENLALAWSDKFELFLWSSPRKLPWMKDRCWSNTIIPIIYKKLQNNAEFIDIIENDSCCEVIPSLNCNHVDLYILFLSLLAALHNKYNRLAICLSLNNIPPKNYEFKVNDEHLQPTPLILSSADDFLRIYEVDKHCWPTNGDDSKSLEKGIHVILQRDYNKGKSICEFSFSKPFLKKLSITINDRDKILNAIAKRLSMTRAEAARDSGLQDEKIQDIRRFRVTLCKRIHYKDDSGKINFLMFYDDGEHDDGL